MVPDRPAVSNGMVKMLEGVWVVNCFINCNLNNDTILKIVSGLKSEYIEAF